MAGRAWIRLGVLTATVLLVALSWSASPPVASKKAWQAQLARSAARISKAKFAWAKHPKARTVALPAKNRGAGSAGNKAKVKHADTDCVVQFPDGTLVLMTAEEAITWHEQVHAAENAALEQAESHYKAGRLAEARALLEPLVRDTASQWGSELLAQICVEEDKYSEALALLAPFISENAGDDLMTLAALSSAMVGQTFDGQKAFTDQVVLGPGLSGSGYAEALPQGAGLLECRISAWLAEATIWDRHGNDGKASIFYLKVLNLAPTNLLANMELAEYHMRRSERALAVPMLQIVVGGATGELKVRAERRLADAQ